MRWDADRNCCCGVLSMPAMPRRQSLSMLQPKVHLTVLITNVLHRCMAAIPATAFPGYGATGKSLAGAQDLECAQ